MSREKNTPPESNILLKIGQSNLHCIPNSAMLGCFLVKAMQQLTTSAKSEARTSSLFPLGCMAKVFVLRQRYDCDCSCNCSCDCMTVTIGVSMKSNMRVLISMCTYIW